MYQVLDTRKIESYSSISHFCVISVNNENFILVKDIHELSHIPLYKRIQQFRSVKYYVIITVYALINILMK